jgi:transketolase
VIIIATGSEVHIALDAGQQLSEGGTASRVVSMPSWELFDGQSQDYKNSVLPPNITARVSIEAGSPMGWERYVGLNGRIIGLPHFGASAPAATLYEKFGLTAQRVIEEAKSTLQQVKS